MNKKKKEQPSLPNSLITNIIPDQTKGVEMFNNGAATLGEDIQHSLTAQQKQELQKFTRKADTAEEVNTFIAGMVSQNEKINENIDDYTLNSDNTESSEEPDASFGISNLFIDLINRKYENVEALNSMLVTLEAEDYTTYIPVIENILNDENNTIGQLQQVVELLQPSAETIDAGKTEAIEILELDETAFAPVDESLTESIKNEKNIKHNTSLLKGEEVSESLTEDTSEPTYYVSYYEETPTDDALSVASCQLLDSIKCDSLDEAKEKIIELAEEDGMVSRITDEFYLDRSKYIGQDRFYIIETEQGSEVI